MRGLVAPGSPERQDLVERLLGSTGLSRKGVEWALDHCLELDASDAELAQLLARTPRAARAHVLLSANVFVAAYRALAVALCVAPSVAVRPSRREPVLAEALCAAAPGLFECVSELRPEQGDHVFAYGGDVTLEELRAGLPEGVILHAHGSGFGVAVVDLHEGLAPALEQELARGIARDAACFEQRGCLSPRFVLALGPSGRAERFAQQLADALVEIERDLPAGRLEHAELHEAAWYREHAACFGRVHPAGSGAVSWREGGEPPAPLDVPPPGRHLEVSHAPDLGAALAGLAPWITSAGCSSAALERQLRDLLPRARVTRIGRMQRPPLDGPADLRPDPRGQRIAHP